MKEGTHEDTITMLERLQEENEELRERITTLEVTNMNLVSQIANHYEELKVLYEQRKQLFLAIHWDDVFDEEDRTFEIDMKAPLMIWKGWKEEDFEGEW